MTEKPKAVLTMDKYYLYVERVRDGKRVRYNLKDLELEKEKNNMWIAVEHQYKFFQGIFIDDVQFKDKKFEKVLELVSKLNPDCRSVSTFLTRIPDCIKYETYISEGVEFDVYASKDYNWNGGYEYSIRGITEPLTFYDKETVRFFKNKNITVTAQIQQVYNQNKKAFQKIVYALVNSEMNEEASQETMRSLFQRGRGFDNFSILTNDFHYDAGSLLSYIWNYLVPFEALTFSESLDLLKDYYDMAHVIGRKVKKYPKYLKSMHDIIAANYNSFKREYDEALFERIMKKELEYEDREFSIVVPKTTKDIIKEGTDLNHCVSSYVDRILRRETYIFFLRKTKEKEDSLVTLECRGEQIVQAKGAYNRKLTEEERTFLAKYCKKMQIELSAS